MQKRVEVYGSDTKEFVTSRDVLFDKISSWHSSGEISEVTTLYDSSKNLKLFSQKNEEVTIESKYQENVESSSRRRCC